MTIASPAQITTSMVVGATGRSAVCGNCGTELNGLAAVRFCPGCRTQISGLVIHVDHLAFGAQGGGTADPAQILELIGRQYDGLQVRGYVELRRNPHMRPRFAGVNPSRIGWPRCLRWARWLS